MDEIRPFKQCPLCSQTWQTREEFLADPLLSINGYAVDFEKLESGLFFFTHLKEQCKSTMALEARYFLDLHKGAKHPERKTWSDECPLYCLDKEQLDRCKAFCEYAFVRETIQMVKNWKKS